LQVVPVLDVMEGHVVRGIAGQRALYRKIESRLTESSDPREVAEAIRCRFGLSEIYVADLDAILGGTPNLSVLRSLCEADFTVMADAGCRHSDDAAPIRSAGVQQIVAGLETLAGPEEMSRLLQLCGPQHVVFSLDLRGGRPMGDATKWRTADPLAIVEQVIEAGFTQLIVLDIATVGTAAGVPTLALCAEIRRLYPQVRLIAGGGLRNVADLRDLAKHGVDAALIASALHNGSIGPAELASIAAPLSQL
jgi:phosphoribosylformimino-5-aminoimidazole carboxamide ribotide isomerase